MFEKWADKHTKLFSKKAVENVKAAITEDVKKNQTGYIMAGITGIVIAVGVVTLVKGMIGGSSTIPVMTYSVVYNITVNN